MELLGWLTDPAVWAALLTLTALEIVLGIDNLIFISVAADRLPRDKQALARRLGLVGALVMRLALLASVAWIVSLKAPLFAAFGFSFSWRDLILICGGAFLVYKGTQEIHEHIEGNQFDGDEPPRVTATLARVIASIMALDIVFSLDSVITAVGMSDDFSVMATAVVVAVIIMMFAAGPVARFVNTHPTVKMLALSFLLLIGMVLVADGFSFHVPKGFIYAAIGFSIFVEGLNMMARKKRRAG